jgi:molecular chaperone DnaJ
MTLTECYRVLGLKPGVDMAEIKRAYRRLAFSLHPDLNPSVPDAARRFQRLNEAYVYLSHAKETTSRVAEGGDSSTSRAREEAQKAYMKARQGQSGAPSGGHDGRERPKEDVLKDILNDPFARRVFEDIYSHIKGEESQKSAGGGTPASGGKPERREKTRVQASGPRQAKAQDTPLLGSDMLDRVKGWLRKQIDDEQIIRLPRESLVPGARVRLEIQHGFSGEPHVVEITLPPEFSPGKPMRLKGLGRRLGSLHGDLYVRIEPS